jgi:hypothetical protein
VCRWVIDLLDVPFVRAEDGEEEAEEALAQLGFVLLVFLQLTIVIPLNFEKNEVEVEERMKLSLKESR